MWAAACGASVGAGSGSVRTAIASAPATPPATSPASSRSGKPGVSARACASIARSLAEARTSRSPVKPPPIAASVNATSTPCNCTHATVSSRPYAMKPTVAANVSRTTVV